MGMKWGLWYRLEKRMLATGRVLFAVEEWCLLVVVAVVVVEGDRRHEHA